MWLFKTAATHIPPGKSTNLLNGSAIFRLDKLRLRNRRFVVPQYRYHEGDEAKGERCQLQSRDGVTLVDPSELLDGEPQGLEYCNDTRGT